ncbi:MAG: Microfibrillar-associated protein 1, partial [Paramarteilia canceri]
LVDKEITASEVADDNIGADIQSLILDLPSDDENSETYETEYQKWRIRELKRLKRDKLELQQMRMEKEQVQKLHEMNEEQRIAFFAKNPKMVSNHAEKGRYKFLQKYYHRGVFYLDKEDDIYKRNVDLATEDDNFDRSKLPKLMQVRNFGKANRTKYTHLVNEDTNDYLTPLKNNDLMKDMYMKRSGGVKQQFEKPSRRK